MPSTKIAPTSDPTLTKLLEVDADLATQETQLTAHIEALQQKRKGLQTVIGIFAPNNGVETSNTSSSGTVGRNGSVAESVTEDATLSPSARKTGATETESKRGKKTPSTPKVTAHTPAKTAAKGTRKVENWQQYMKKEFSQASLPEAVSKVLQNQPDQAFETLAVVDAIFTDKMPSELRNQARDRVSNVLSVGLKSNKWHRGKKGCYSASKAAAAASVAS